MVFPFRYLIRDSSHLLIFRRIFSENFGVYRNRYILAILCLFAIAGTTAFSAWLMGPIVTDVFYEGDVDRAIFLSLAITVTFLAKGIFSYSQAVILSRIGNSIVARYQRSLFSHLLRLGVEFFDARHSVSLVARLNQNIGAIRQMLNTVVLSVARDAVTLVGLLFVMFWRDFYLTLSVLVIAPLALRILSGYAQRVKRITRDQVEVTAQVSASMQEASHGIKVVKSFTMEDTLREKLNELTRQVEDRSNKIERITARTSPLMETLSGLAIAAVVAYGGLRVSQGIESAGDLASFVTALLLAYEPAKRLARLRLILERSLVNGQMIYEILDTPPHADDGGASPLEVSSGEISFEDVHFRYDSSSEHRQIALNGMTFTALASKTTALVGPSGGGKTTILSLLERFYSPQSGTIKIDNQDISTVTLSSLRHSVGYVSQSPILFAGTIKENIRYGNPSATDDDIISASKSAQAHDFIMDLPQGYDTPLAEDGSNLSGGQRQRLSIARALVRDAPILLLDEATSALDNESESKIQEALSLLRGRTILIVAHRLTTIQNADEIIVIESGRVVDRGDHTSLMSSGGLYSRLQSVGGY